MAQYHPDWTGNFWQCDAMTDQGKQCQNYCHFRVQVGTEPAKLCHTHYRIMLDRRIDLHPEHLRRSTNVPVADHLRLPS